jgi:hypothetical protein
MRQTNISIAQVDTQCNRSTAHLLLAETHSTQSTNCYLLLLLKTFYISTLGALKVCAWCIFHVKSSSKYSSSRHTVQQKHCTLATGRDTQYTVNKLSLAPKDVLHQHFRCTQSLCLVYLSCNRLIQVQLKQTHSAKEALHTCYWQRHTVHSQQIVTCS